jgi:hypothetical protein
MKPDFCQNPDSGCKFAVGAGSTISVDDDGIYGFCTVCGVPLERFVDIRGSKHSVRLTQLAYDGLRMPTTASGNIGDSLVSCSQCGDLAHIAHIDRQCMSPEVASCSGTYRPEADGVYATRQNADNNALFLLRKPSTSRISREALRYELIREPISSDSGCSLLMEAGVLGLLSKNSLRFIKSDCVIQDVDASLKFYSVALPRIIPTPAHKPLACMYAGKYYVFMNGLVSCFDYSKYLSTGIEDWSRSEFAFSNVTAVTAGNGFVACLVTVGTNYRIHVWAAHETMKAAKEYALPDGSSLLQPVRLILHPGLDQHNHPQTIHVLSAVIGRGHGLPRQYVIDCNTGTVNVCDGVVACVSYGNSIWTVKESPNRSFVSLYCDGTKIGPDHEYDTLQHPAGVPLVLSDSGPIWAVERMDTTVRARIDKIMGGAEGERDIHTFDDGAAVTENLMVRKVRSAVGADDVIHVWRRSGGDVSQHFAFSKVKDGPYGSDASVESMVNQASFHSWVVDSKWLGVVVRNQVGNENIFELLAYRFV